MIQKPLNQIDKEVIESLVSAKVSEKRTLDYKQQLPGRSDEQKREFLYDVSSFANALGGDLVFGIEDERDTEGKATGLPAAACGVAVSNTSSEIARLENLIRDGIEPRVQGIQWKTIDGFSRGLVIVMRVPKSLFGPHMVVFGGMARFYSRNSTGKYLMDITEIRSAFVESMAISERLRAFKSDRLRKIARGETPLASKTGSKVVIHLIPFSALSPVASRDVTRDAADPNLRFSLSPVGASASGHRFNFDGFLLFSHNYESYVQVFRSGVIEAVSLLLNESGEYKDQIPSIAFEETINKALDRYLKVQNLLAIPLPIFAATTLLGVKNYRMSSMFTGPSEPIDRDNLELPEILVEEYNVEIAKLVRPAFDALWQACGLEKSANYDDEGNWRAHHS